MKSTVLLFFLFIAGCSFAQTSGLVSLKNTEQFIVESVHFKNEPFTIQVCLPKNYNSSSEYPVAYLLDADKSIGMAKDITDWLMFRGEIIDIIIVGIAYNKDDETWWTNRSRDFSPTRDTVSQTGKSFPKAGGAGYFLDFIKNDLKPEIENRYKISKSEESLIGFSFGGLFAAWSLFTNPALFDNYIIISPALFWDNALILKLENQYFQSLNELDKKVFIAISSNDSRNLVIDPTKKLVDQIKSRSYSGLNLIFDEYENETHFSGYPRALTTGIKRIYLK